MPIAVLPALPSDTEAVYDAYFSSFSADPLGKIILDILFPSGVDDVSFRKAHADGVRQWGQTCPTQYTFKCVDVETGEVIGMMLLDIYLVKRSLAERSIPGAVWLSGEQRERADNVIQPLWKKREEIFGGKPYTYCHAMAVHPAHQGRGAGLELCKSAIELSDRLGLPIYLESSPSAEGLYRKAGFQRLEETVVHSAAVVGTDEDLEVPLMVWMPPKLEGGSFSKYCYRDV